MVVVCVYWTGIVTTLAGTGNFFEPSDAKITSSGVVYVADTGNNCIRRLSTGS